MPGELSRPLAREIGLRLGSDIGGSSSGEHYDPFRECPHTPDPGIYT